MQHADHFTRILNEKENFKREKLIESKVERKDLAAEEIQDISNEISEKNVLENPEQTDDSKIEKSQVKAS